MPRIEDIILRDALASRPAANAVVVGALFYDTTNSILYRSNGTSWESVEGAGGDHGGLTGLTDDDHSQYPLVTNFEADRATIASRWDDLTDGGETSLHTHAGASEQKTPPFADGVEATKFADRVIGGLSVGVTELADGEAVKLSITDAIEFIIDGGGSAITTGIKGDLEIPFACTITQATLLADQSGSIVIDIWKDTYNNYPPTDADSITASAPPTISTATKSQDSSLTGWTTLIAAGDTLRFNVDSITTVTRVTLSLKITR